MSYSGREPWDANDPYPATEDETMMRTLDGHKVNPANDLLTITVMDPAGQGGASHFYNITGFDSTKNPTFTDGEGADFCELVFQNGPIAEHGVNGITHEALLAILIDRLDGFQSGPYACGENLIALNHLIEARDVLNSRTQRRMAEGTEGTHALDANADAVTLPPEALP